jgi:hypothetical protein
MDTDNTIINRLSRFERDTKTRLTRIESKLVRGFEELGISTDTNDDWLTVDDEARIVYVDTIGRSLMVLLADMSRAGATHFGDHYEVVHKGITVAVVELRKVI